jgi:hypothetical protein
MQAMREKMVLSTRLNISFNDKTEEPSSISYEDSGKFGAFYDKDD